MAFRLQNYPGAHNRYTLLKTIFFFSLLLVTASCSSPPEPEIISLSDQEAAEDAQAIRSKVSVKLADDLELHLWASEKLLADPIGLDITDKGEAYVTVTNRRGSSKLGIRAHPEWMLESLSWTRVEDRSAFLTRELAPENSSQNTWLEDVNGDGSHDWKDLSVEEEIFKISDQTGDEIADHSQLYYRGFNEKESDVAGTVLAIDNDVYIGVAPDMWRTRDTNNDGIADTRTAISSGYAVHIGYRGHGMSGLKIGPDGKIYWSIGDVGLNVEDTDGKRWSYPNQGAILRSDPDGSNFEVFAAGLRNPHEFAFDKYGNLITVDHDGDHAGEEERVVYAINGSDSGWRINWQFGKYSDPKNNGYNVWMDENYFKPRFENQAAHILPPLDNYINGASGMTYNPGTALNEKWRDHFFVSYFVGAAAGSAINAFDLKPKGASFELRTDQPVMEGILPTGIDFGPDGALYFADWVTGWNTNDQGRIWKLDTSPETHSEIRIETKKLLAEDLGSLSKRQLSDLLFHQDMRVRQKAQFELVKRSSKKELLSAIQQKEYQLARLHGIWGVGQLARKDIEEADPLIPYLSDKDPEIRAQAAKTLGDVRYKPAADALIPLLKDESLRVRFFAAQALGRIQYQPAVQPIIAMLEANNDEDVYLRHGGAIALERIGDVEALAGLADHPSEAVRIAAVVALKRLEDPAVARFLNDESEFIVTNTARAINDDAFIDEALPDLAQMLDRQTLTNTPLLRRAINASLYSGTAADAKRLASFAAREGVPDSLRTEAIATLSVWPDPSTLDRVTGRYRGEISNKKADAVNAISSIVQPLLSGDNAPVQIALAKAIEALGLTQMTSDLHALMQESSSPEVKIAVLNTLHSLEDERMDDAIATALKTNDQQLRMVALEFIPALDIPDRQKVELLSSVLNNGSISEQQSAIMALGSMESPEAVRVLKDQFSKLINGTLPRGIQLELVQAADSADAKPLDEMLKQYNSAREEDNIVAKYQETLYGGNAERGSRIFYNNSSAQCIRCHSVGEEGGNAGPDLSTIGNTLSREQLLESMLAPDKRIAPGFGSVTITTRTGENLQGMLVEETAVFLKIQTSDGTIRQVPKEEIAKQENSPSGMYSMEGILTKRQLRDLIEFLSHRPQDAPSEQQAPKAHPND
ncbi:HEAT repeat domain-containing protein [Fodinibius sediminis]|uniref:Putative heme-binding domain-containing protein n=1 Tax=Fodinibius sediminis TaxID=1214077 RepID=A0A521CTL6_9BACT|nr:HEAT repeat domain-containing protein [Fodinibius sediminis]SMO62837.1 putative heme-binding domain-containing protein [Fodinibius sediminis]